MFIINSYNQGRIYYEAKEAGASGPGAGGGPRAFFPANFIYIHHSNLAVGPGPGDSLKSWRACLCGPDDPLILTASYHSFSVYFTSHI